MLKYLLWNPIQSVWDCTTTTDLGQIRFILFYLFILLFNLLSLRLWKNVGMISHLLLWFSKPFFIWNSTYVQTTFNNEWEKNGKKVRKSVCYENLPLAELWPVNFHNFTRKKSLKSAFSSGLCWLPVCRPSWQGVSHWNSNVIKPTWQT